MTTAIRRGRSPWVLAAPPRPGAGSSAPPTSNGRARQHERAAAASCHSQGCECAARIVSSRSRLHCMRWLNPKPRRRIGWQAGDSSGAPDALAPNVRLPVVVLRPTSCAGGRACSAGLMKRRAMAGSRQLRARRQHAVRVGRPQRSSARAQPAGSLGLIGAERAKSAEVRSGASIPHRIVQAWSRE
jgi:hypothetical protein